jgi:hypothetical protein
VDEEVGARMRGAHVRDVARPDAGMDVALAVPHVHRAARPLLDVGAEEHVGPEEDLRVGAVLAVDVLDDRHRVRRGDAVVRLRLHVRRRVDVHDYDGARMARLPGPQLLGGDGVGERAARVRVGQQDGLVRAEDRRRLGHEVDAAEGDHLFRRGGGLLREPERVADEVGHLLDLGELVVVGEDDGAALPGERAHLVLQRRDVVELEERHRVVSRRRDRSSAGAEWVRAPIETKSSPFMVE